MRKSQKYSKEEMFLAIEMWRESGLAQIQFCDRENLSIATFGYWLKKYRKEKGQPKPSREKTVKAFIPVEVPKTIGPASTTIDQIGITYPNGVKVTCPASIGIQQLKTLINL